MTHQLHGQLRIKHSPCRDAGETRWRREAAALVGALALLLNGAAQAQVAPPDAQVSNRRCLNCHGDPAIATAAPRNRYVMLAPTPEAEAALADAPAERPGLHLPADHLTGVHSGLACVDCHVGVELPHVATLPPAQCASCHAQQQMEFTRSIHAEAQAAGDPFAPTCASCHGTHKILPPENRESMMYRLNIIQVCGDCHSKHHTPARAGAPDTSVSSYLESVHGHAVAGAGLVAAATCADCHGWHEVHATHAPQSRLSRENVAETCGSCHVGIVDIYDDSIHGRLLAQGDPRAPICTDCHTGHAITNANVPAFTRDIVNECGFCHDQPEMHPGRASFYDTYRMTYHGQVTALGSARAARCSDCHGAHDILPEEDPLSRVHEANLLDTCQSCHPGANANFAMYEPHADYTDRERYPILNGVWWYFIIVMSSAFGFFGLHSILWFFRSLIERLKHGKHPRPTYGTKGIRRFTLVNRINHGFVIITFFGLTITGLPLLFSDQVWAQGLMNFIGGVGAAGSWHRFFAIMLFGNFAVHFYSIYRSAKARKGPLIRGWLLGPNSMVPRLKDVTDCLGMARWFFRGGKKPRFDRFTYWEKFDYWAEIGGTGIIGASGLLLWFPELFSMFLPGWMFNVATIVHGYEALLAIGFIFTIHFFNAHLRAEKFPVDDVIFTGMLPEEEFKHERAAEYERLAAEGVLEEYRVDAPAKWTRKAAVAVGIAAMTIGTTLVVLIILAGLGVI